MDPGCDRRIGGDRSVTDTSDLLFSLFRDLSCVDVWRSLHPSQQAYTWFRADGTRASRIDLIGCPASWLPSVSSSDILACPVSDHAAVSLSLTSLPNAVPRGPGFWKLNTSILAESDYISEISAFWSVWRDSRDSFTSLLDWWGLGKARIETLSIRYCQNRSAKKTARFRSLTQKVAALKTLVDLGHVSALSDYKDALSALQEFSLDQACGAQIHSRARWVEEGESSTAYFFRLERKRKAESTISSLKVCDRTVTSTDDLLASASDFYKNLYSSCETDPVVQDELLSNLSLSLSSEEADLCEGDLSIAECFNAVKGMAKSKMPGFDGLPAEFYLALWPVLGSDLVDFLNYAFRVGFLSISQRRGLINLVFKADDRTLLKNWRPISLLCVDYKIGSCAIAGRLLRVINRVVSPDQTPGVPGRFIGENVAYVRDAIQYATVNNLPLAVLTLDQEKAFDRVEWGFLFCFLERMGFGPSFCKWVQILYTGVQSSVIVNGHLSEFFNLHRGVRQGFPLSPLLYVLVAEVLAASLKACPRIKGLSLPAPMSSPSFLSQYADDTSILVTTDDSILAVFEVFDRYELGSGARLNLKKCKGLWVGAWLNRAAGPVDIGALLLSFAVSVPFLVQVICPMKTGVPGSKPSGIYCSLGGSTPSLFRARLLLSMPWLSLVFGTLALFCVPLIGSFLRLTRKSFPSSGLGRKTRLPVTLFVSRSLPVGLVSLTCWPSFVPSMCCGFVISAGHPRTGPCSSSCSAYSFLVMILLLPWLTLLFILMIFCHPFIPQCFMFGACWVVILSFQVCRSTSLVL